MFDLYGRTSQKNYAKWSVATLGIYALVALLINLSVVGCTGIGCLAAGAIGFLIQLPLAVIAVFLLVPPAIRRCRDAGLPPFLGLLVPFLFAIDPTVLVLPLMIVSHQRLDPGMGAFAASGVACMLALCLLPSVARPDLRRFGWLGIVTVVASLPALVLLVTRMSYVVPLWPLLGPLMGRSAGRWQANQPALLAVPGILLLVLALLNRKPKPAPVAADELAPEVRLPLYRLALLALAIALVASTLLVPGWTSSSSGMFEMLGAVSAIALLYFIPVLAIALVAKRQWLPAGVLAALFATLLGPWAYAHWLAAQVDAETRQIATSLSPLKPIESYPTILVVSPTYRGDPYDRLYLEGQTQLIEGEPGAYYAIGKRKSEHIPLDALPDRYLLIGNGHASAYYTSGMRTASHLLTLVADGKQDVIAEHYDADIPPPTLLPVVQAGQWAPGRYIRPSADIDGREFLKTALAGATPEAE